MSARYPVSLEARVHLDGWNRAGKRLFEEVMEDAASDLQRELIQRAIAAGHDAGEVHAFADELRGLSDDSAYAACTLESTPHADFTIAQLLRAEADPLFAFELKGGELSPTDEAPVGPQLTPPPALRSDALGIPGADPVELARRRRNAALGVSTHQPPARRDEGDAFGVTTPPLPKGVARQAPPEVQETTGGQRFIEDLVNEATRGLGLSWREVEVDGTGWPMERALVEALEALRRGVPVPCAIGPKEGVSRRFVLLLNTDSSGKNRAIQLFDPLSQELVWANENDLLRRTELPFANKSNRRITRIALPTSLRSAALP